MEKKMMGLAGERTVVHPRAYVFVFRSGSALTSALSWHALRRGGSRAVAVARRFETSLMRYHGDSSSMVAKDEQGVIGACYNAWLRDQTDATSLSMMIEISNFMEVGSLLGVEFGGKMTQKQLEAAEQWVWRTEVLLENKDATEKFAQAFQETEFAKASEALRDSEWQDVWDEQVRDLTKDHAKRLLAFLAKQLHDHCSCSGDVPIAVLQIFLDTIKRLKVALFDLNEGT